MRNDDRLSLTGWRKVWYYLPLVYVSGGAIVMYAISSYALGIAFTIFAMLVARNRYRGLRFVSVRTDRSALNNYALARSLINRTDWTINRNVHAEVIEAYTNPPLWRGSWGELVTLKFESGRILINSICDPDRYPSVASWGQNRRNLSFLSKALAEDTTRPCLKH